MLANYHVHTNRCRHAIGTDEEYVQKAIAEGLKTLGFSDHAPYLYPDGYVSYYKMTPEESGEYFSSIYELKEKYRDKIDIHIGYEAEFYPELWESTFKFWETTNRPEYLILGQHFVGKEYDERERTHSATGTEENRALSKYVDTLISAINTDRFTYVAHPDVIRFFGDRDFYEKEMRRLLSAIVKKDIPIEINLLGLSEGRHYPTPLFWETASEYSPRTVLGCDAHEPWRVADKSEIYMAQKFAEKYRLNLIDELTLIDPFSKRQVNE